VCIREPVLKLEDSRSIRCNSRIIYTCVRILEELLIVINSCVLSLECNKLPS
jgi:IMP cyclohydrolase